MSENQLEAILAQHQFRDDDIVDVEEPTIKLVIFNLGERTFAFVGAAIREVLPGNEQVFFVPGMPASVEGVMNVRGDIESVIRLHTLLDLVGSHEVKKTPSASILLGQGAGMHSGLRVDQLIDVVDIPQSQIQATPETLPETLRPFVSGLLEFRGLAVAVLDLDKLFVAWQRGQG
jgi:purine-binding chemotaxis protein CheW